MALHTPISGPHHFSACCSTVAECQSLAPGPQQLHPVTEVRLQSRLWYPRLIPAGSSTHSSLQTHVYCPLPVRFLPQPPPEILLATFVLIRTGLAQSPAEAKGNKSVTVYSAWGLLYSKRAFPHHIKHKEQWNTDSTCLPRTFSYPEKLSSF